jgi:hypothetical protein
VITGDRQLRLVRDRLSHEMACAPPHPPLTATEFRKGCPTWPLERRHAYAIRTDRQGDNRDRK